MSRSTKQAVRKVDQMTAAYIIAEKLAAIHVRVWAIDAQSGTEDRNDAIGAVYDVLTEYSGRREPQQLIQEVLDQHVADVQLRNSACDGTTDLLVQAADAGYLYGLAVGMALAKGGAR